MTNIATLYANTAKASWAGGTPQKIKLDAEHTVFDCKIMSKRSGERDLEITLPCESARKGAPDRALPVLINGNTKYDKQVGAVFCDGSDIGLVLFSRSERGKEWQKSFIAGDAQMELAHLTRGKRKSPAAFSIRAVSDGEIGVNTMSEHNVIPKETLRAEIDAAVKRRIPDEPIYTPFLTGNEEREYSLSNAIRGQISGRLDGYEAEVHQELTRTMPVTPRGVVVPNMLLQKRTTMTTSNISNLTQSTPRDDLFIDALQPASAVMAANATTISGLEKSITVAAFTAEGSAVSESSLTFDSITMTAKRISATSSYTMESLMQSDPNIDQLIRNSQARKVGQVLDDNAMGGSGSGANPRGILNTTGISTVSTGDTTMTRTEALSALSQLETNDVPSGSATFLIDPADYAIIAATAVDSGSGVFVIEGNQILGRNVIQSSLVSNGTIILGDFSHLLIGLFGSTDLIVDPYSSASSAIVKITTHTFADIAVRQPKAFCKITLS